MAAQRNTNPMRRSARLSVAAASTPPVAIGREPAADVQHTRLTATAHTEEEAPRAPRSKKTAAASKRAAADAPRKRRQAEVATAANHGEDAGVGRAAASASVRKRPRNSVSVSAARAPRKSKAFASTETAAVASDAAAQIESKRLQAMLFHEEAILVAERQRLVAQGRTAADIDAEMARFIIVGVDEVGVGPLAGPLVSCATALRQPDAASGYGQGLYAGINDSKKLKAGQREALAATLQAHARGYCLAAVSAAEVDTLNPRQASMEAMRRAVMSLLATDALAGCRVHLLVDYHTVPHMPDAVVVGQTSLEKGDAKSQSIAAASIIAKVYRDAYMARLHEQYPHFGFVRNAGYGTREHLAALKQGLLCPDHRLSFAPVKEAHRLTTSAAAPSPTENAAVAASAQQKIEGTQGETEAVSSQKNSRAVRKPRTSTAAASGGKETKAPRRPAASAAKHAALLSAATGQGAAEAAEQAQAATGALSLPLVERAIPNDFDLAGEAVKLPSAAQTSGDKEGTSAIAASSFTFRMPVLTRLSAWLTRG